MFLLCAKLDYMCLFKMPIMFKPFKIVLGEVSIRSRLVSIINPKHTQ